MNWKQIIKKINKEYPKLTPDKLYDFVEKTYGSKSDIKELKAEWVNIVIKSIKGFKGVPSSVDRKKLSLQKRINYFVNSKNFKFSWQLFHPHYYNDGPYKNIDNKGNPTGEIFEDLWQLGPSNVSDKEFRAMDHTRNITRILQRAKFKK
jgi:hypothetical protein|tara:strand:+ start:87 stop:533 length:447 start_codon:yes stop_codon:yes gene_type:complete